MERAAVSAREKALAAAAAEFCARFEEGVTDDDYTYCRLKNALGTGREEYSGLVHKTLENLGRGAIYQCRLCGKTLITVMSGGHVIACEPDGRPHGPHCPAGRSDNG
jgi:hypothetical protein